MLFQQSGGSYRETLRSFIAIELPEAVRTALSEFQRELQKCGADVRWVKPQGIHLTLKFLGEISEKDAHRITGAIEGTVKHYSCFNLRIRGAGVFPNRKSPRVLWTGAEESATLQGLQREIEDAMSALGFEKEDRRFSPHLTLGRFRSTFGKEPLMEQLELNKDRDLGYINVEAVSFMKSELGPSGAKYTKLAEALLRK